MSALRAAARTKPVVVLKIRSVAGPACRDCTGCGVRRRVDARRVRYACERTRNCSPRRGFLRAGGFRRETGWRSCPTDAVPALLAADAAADRGLRLGTLTRDTVKKLDALLHDGSVRASNPIDVGGDAPPDSTGGRGEACARRSERRRRRCAARPASRHTGRSHRRRRSRRYANGLGKPVLAAWLGAVDRQRGSRRARSRRRLELLHAGERRRRAVVPRCVSQQPGVVARSAATAARTGAARPGAARNAAARDSSIPGERS